MGPGPPLRVKRRLRSVGWVGGALLRSGRTGAVLETEWRCMESKLSSATESQREFLLSVVPLKELNVLLRRLER